MQLNANLTSIHSFQENVFVSKLAENCTEEFVWLGGKLVGMDPVTLVWLDGSESDFIGFADNKAGSGIWGHDSIALIKKDFNWYNFEAKITSQSSFVCEKKV